MASGMYKPAASSFLKRSLSLTLTKSEEVYRLNKIMSTAAWVDAEDDIDFEFHRSEKYD